MRMEEMSKTAIETIVDYNQQDDTAHVFTYDPALQKKMDKLCADHPEEVCMTVECNGSKNYTFPKSWLKITAPRKKKVTAGTGGKVHPTDQALRPYFCFGACILHVRY